MRLAYMCRGIKLNMCRSVLSDCRKIIKCMGRRIKLSSWRFVLLDCRVVNKCVCRRMKPNNLMFYSVLSLRRVYFILGFACLNRLGGPVVGRKWQIWVRVQLSSEGFFNVKLYQWLTTW